MNKEALKSISQAVSHLATTVDVAGQGQFQEFTADRTFTTGERGDSTLINLLINSPVATNAAIYRDPVSGKYLTRPWVTVSNEPLDDAGGTCCVQGPGTQACQHAQELNFFCVYDCVENIMDVLMEDEPIVGSNDLQSPYKATNDSLNDMRVKKLGIDYRFYFARNIILGNLTSDGGGLRPFVGLVEAMLNPAVASFTGSAGISRAISAIECRIQALGGAGNWIMVGNPITLTSIKRQLEATSGNSTLPSGWSLVNGYPSYGGITPVASQFMPVDLATGLGEVVLIDLNRVGLKLVRPLEQPRIFEDINNTNSTPNCGEKCVYLYNAGAIVTNDYNGIIRIPNVAIDSACRLGLSGLEGFVNPTVPFPAQA